MSSLFRSTRHSFSLYFVLCLLLGTGVARAQQPVVAVVPLDTTIQPVSAAYLDRALGDAARQHAAAVLVEMDTPGGMLDSMRTMVHSILTAPMPVIVYVTPAGARAGSAGFFLLEAADVAAMAPGTNAGAAHPVIEGGTMDPVMKQKLENDATALLRSYAEPRGRNLAAAQDAVLNSKSYSAEEALQLKLIDVIAPNAPALLQMLNGRTVKRLSGATVVLHLANARLLVEQPSLRERVLAPLMDPNLAVLLLIGGALLIFLEFHVPGTIVPGTLGSLMVILSLFALQLLPLRASAVVFLLAAVLLLMLEFKTPSHGVLGLAGIGCLVFGLATLIAAPVPELGVSLLTALGAGFGFGFVTLFLVRAAVRARRNKLVTGSSAMLGAIAVAQEAIAPHGSAQPRGQVLVRGELWLAEAPQPAPAGAYLRVVGVRGLTLLVEPVPVP